MPEAVTPDRAYRPPSEGAITSPDRGPQGERRHETWVWFSVSGGPAGPAGAREDGSSGGPGQLRCQAREPGPATGHETVAGGRTEPLIVAIPCASSRAATAPEDTPRDRLPGPARRSSRPDATPRGCPPWRGSVTFEVFDESRSPLDGLRPGPVRPPPWKESSATKADPQPASQTVTRRPDPPRIREESSDWGLDGAGKAG